jgi:hypothetical protein
VNASLANVVLDGSWTDNDSRLSRRDLLWEAEAEAGRGRGLHSGGLQGVVDSSG